MKTEGTETGGRLGSIGSALVIVCCFCAMLSRVDSGELWCHVRAGQWIVENRSVPKTDLFSLALLIPRGPFLVRHETDGPPTARGYLRQVGRDRSATRSAPATGQGSAAE